eukprot:6194503-Pleurochrysis_carterae.AAC.1
MHTSLRGGEGVGGMKGKKRNRVGRGGKGNDCDKGSSEVGNKSSKKTVEAEGGGAQAVKEMVEAAKAVRAASAVEAADTVEKCGESG